MSYTINKTDGTTFAVVLDGTLDTTTSSLDLIGQNYEGYGEALNENYVRLLESHANLTEPPAPHKGQLWYNTVGDGVLTVHNGTEFKSIAIAAVDINQPGTSLVGEQWYDNTNKQLKVFNGTTYDLVGPAHTTAEGLSGEVVETITSGGGTPVDHIVTKYYIGGVVYAILSEDATFTPDVPITGFSDINPGLEMSSATPNIIGDASNALELNGVPAATYLRSDQANSIINDGGLTIGVGGDLTLTVTADVAEIRNVTSNGAIEIYANIGGTDTKVLWMESITGFRPQVRPPSSGLDIATVAYVGTAVSDATLSDSEIKTQYENNADTNEFSDAEQTKLAGIETGATDSETFTAAAGNLAIIDLDSSQTITSTLTANVSLTTLNRAAGLKVDVIYEASGGPWTVTFASWISFGEASGISIPAGKRLILSLTCIGNGTEADVHCAAVLEN